MENDEQRNTNKCGVDRSAGSGKRPRRPDGHRHGRPTARSGIEVDAGDVITMLPTVDVVLDLVGAAARRLARRHHSAGWWGRWLRLRRAEARGDASSRVPGRLPG